MAPSTCQRCALQPAVIRRPKDHSRLCRTCFLAAFEDETHATITSHGLFAPGERVAIGASGGKDSTVLAAVLATLNARHGYGLALELLSVDEGIAGYRDDSLRAVARNAAALGLPLRVVGYRELYGWTMDEVVAQVGRRGNCTYCGVFRRQALDRGAALLGVRHVVTGHNADDIAETVLMNLLRGDLPRLARATSIVTASAASAIKRSKPLKYAYEKEIVLYAHHRKLDYFSTECVYSPEAFRGSARQLIKNLEKIRPSAILDIVRSGEDMARCVPEEISGVSAASKATDGMHAAVEDDDEGADGCGSADGRSTGGQMADVEKQLREDEGAHSRETEITSTPVARPPKSRHVELDAPGSQRGPDKAGRRAPRQQMGSCQRCGYLSSQAVCKACVLLEGLNKNRPKTEVQVADGGGDPTGNDGSHGVTDSFRRVSIASGR